MKNRFLFACLFSLQALGGEALNSAPIDIPDNLFASDCKVYFTEDLAQYPFPTELTFFNFCDHKIGCYTTSFDPDIVEAGDTVFVLDSALHWFVENVHPFIKNPYILVSGDSDGKHPSPEAKTILYDPKVAAWFCKNLHLSNHPKLTITPYGQSICQWGDSFSEDYRQYYLKLSAKTSRFSKLDFPLAYINLNSVNHSIRNDAFSLFLNNSFCYTEGTLKNETVLDRKHYWEQLSKFKFLLAPRGQGADTCRIWEAIGLKAIPIIKHSPIDEIYKGTPSILVKDWKDIIEDFLNERFEEIHAQLEQGIISNEKAYFSYWADAINTVKYAIKLKQQGRDQSDLQLTKFDLNSLNTIKGIVLDSSINRDSCLLLVYGKCLALRSFQLANCMPEFQKILIADEYAFDHAKHLNIIKSYAHEDALFVNNHSAGRSEEFTSESVFPQAVAQFSSVRMFIDLTYHRFAFTDQLNQFYQFVPVGTIICGNMATDAYVLDLLQEFSLKNSIPIQYIGDFWYLTIPRFT